MGRLLRNAVAEASKLPEAEQEAVGAWILTEIESERRWDDLFAKSHDMLAEMAAEAIREDEAGLTQPLDFAISQRNSVLTLPASVRPSVKNAAWNDHSERAPVGLESPTYVDFAICRAIPTAPNC